MEKIVRLNEENNKLWNEFVNKNKNSRFYHSLKFKETIEKTYKNCKAEYYLLINNNVKAIFPFFIVKSKLMGNRLISLPFIDNGGFLGEYKKEDTKTLIEELKKIDDLKYIEIRLNSFMENFENDKKILLKLGFNEEKSKNQIILELRNKDVLWECFDRITRKGIKKAEKSKLKIREIKNEEEIKMFYKLYLKNMKNFGAPQHSYKYFSNLFRFLKKEFKGLNCYKDKKLIASLIVLFSKNHIHAAYNSSDNRYLIYQPNDLLHWEIIKWAYKNNIKYFDMGQCEANAEKGTHAEGIYRFKKKWLGEVYQRDYFYYYFDEKDEKKTEKDKDRLKRFRNIWKRLPSLIIKIIGPKIASQLGI